MDSATYTGPTAPFPTVPAQVRAEYSVQELRLRPFGIAPRDLTADFGRGAGPWLITEVLASCTVPGTGSAVDTEFFWKLPIGTRLEGLLVIAGLERAGDFPVVARCLQALCRESMEVEFTLDELVEVQRNAGNGETVNVDMDGERVALRRPTGIDQLQWLRQTFPDEQTGALALLRGLIVEGREVELTPERVAVLEGALADHDPLSAFSMTVSCPSCGETQDHPVDVAALALRRLRDAQAGLIETVHQLARHYHWTESEVLAIPTWRRSRYLSLVAREEAR